MEQKTVLVIEDSQYLADSLVDMLKISNYKPTTANTGRTGISKAIEQKPDLILLDIRLPDIDGYEVYKQVRSNDWGKNARVIILTASESIDNISKNVDLPLEWVLFKPDWSIPDLLAKIKERLEIPLVQE